jgi:arsenic resistance protein ArsH
MTKGNVSNFLNDLPQLDEAHFRLPELSALQGGARSDHPPRIALLYGSLRARSFSRLLTEEAARLLQAMGAQTRIYNPSGLPLPDDAPDTHPKVQELRELVQWSEGMVWTSPERHGAMTGIMKTQIDWVPLNSGAVRPTQGKALAVMQVSGGSQSFNAVKPDARAGKVDAHGHHSQPELGGQGVSGVW